MIVLLHRGLRMSMLLLAHYSAIPAVWPESSLSRLAEQKGRQKEKGIKRPKDTC